MSRKSEAVLTLALDLPEIDRAKVASALVESLVGRPSPEVEEAWRKEVAKRVEGLRAGTAELVPWEAVREELLARISEARAR
jgi:putative addiction module component (TIGR02574 family)